MRLLENHSLLSYNTFGLAVQARYFFEYEMVSDLQTFLQTDVAKNNALYAVGQGSNLLFTKSFDGVVIHANNNYFELLAEDDNMVLLKVGAGVVWDELVAYCVQRNWYGAENLSLIPGTVGAAPVQNIGAYGVEVKDIIEAVLGVDLQSEVQLLTNEACHFAYRDSIFKKSLEGKFFVTDVVFRLSKNEAYNLNYGDINEALTHYDEISLATVRKAIIAIRESKLPDPKVLGNAGSFFKNPHVSKEKLSSLQQAYPGIPYYQLTEDEVKIPAGWLIEQAGWKGKRLGRAAVHDNQALVLVNTGDADGLEILRLSEAICSSVIEQFDIQISPEVIVL